MLGVHFVVPATAAIVVAGRDGKAAKDDLSLRALGAIGGVWTPVQVTAALRRAS
jgi:hypothetical protein